MFLGKKDKQGMDKIRKAKSQEAQRTNDQEDFSGATFGDKLRSSQHGQVLSEVELDADELQELLKQFQSGKVAFLRTENPVRVLAKELRGQVHEFIKQGLREPEHIGFMRNGSSAPILLEGFQKNLSSASAKLEKVFTDDSDQSPPGISQRTFAQTLQLSIDNFRIYLTRGGFGSEVPESRLDEVLDMALSFKGELSSLMQEIDAYYARHVRLVDSEES